MNFNGTTDAWSYRGLRTVIMENDSITAVFLPDKGGILWKLVDRKTGLNLLYTHRDPSLYGSLISTYSKKDPIHDYFMGGWFEALPVAGYGYRGTNLMPEFDLHGETPYRPWSYTIDDRSNLVMTIELFRLPLRLEKTVSLSGSEMRIKERLTNLGTVNLPFSWLHHPCFDLSTFDGSKIAIDVDDIETDSLFVHPYRRFQPGYRGKWPFVRGANGLEYDLSDLNYEPDENYTDTIYMKPNRGSFGIIRKGGPGIRVKWDTKVFPSLWYWIANGGGAYPWFGRARTFSLEISTSYPASGLDDQIANGTAINIGKGEEIDTELRVILLNK